MLNLSTTTNTLTVINADNSSLNLFNSPTAGTDWTQNNQGDWMDSGSEAVVKIDNNAATVKQAYEQTVTFNSETYTYESIEVDRDSSEPKVTFGDSTSNKNEGMRKTALFGT